MAPEVTEIRYWVALTMFSEGMQNDALKIFHDVFEKEPLWVEVTKRLPAAGLLLNDAGQLAADSRGGSRKLAWEVVVCAGGLATTLLLAAARARPSARS